MHPNYAPNSILTYKEGILHFGERSLLGLVQELATPVFLFSEAQLQANYGALLRGLSSGGERVTVRYCAKTNNESALLALLASYGSEVMVSHPAEAQLALQCGFAPEKIAYQRPVLLEEELRAVLESGINLIHAYRLQDLEVIDRLASLLRIKVKISLRLRNDSPGARLSPLNFFSRRLGFRESEIGPAVERVTQSTWMRPYAINFYCGTQQQSTANFRVLMGKVVRICSRIQSHHGVTLEEINFGGGVPSHSLIRTGVRGLWSRGDAGLDESDSPESLASFGRKLIAQYHEQARKWGLSPLPAIAVEPGRSIVGNAGILISRVCAIQGNWLFLDASHNYLGESMLFLRHRILPLIEPANEPQRYYHLSGNTLNTMDVMDFRVKLPPINVGDILCLADAGAYSISRSTRYAGLSPAVYLLRSDGQLRMIRREEGLSDLMSPMITPEIEGGAKDG